jgi:hypothetical protein
VDARITVPATIGALSAWDPVAVRATRLSVSSVKDGRASFDIALPPFGSMFVVPSAAGQGRSAASTVSRPIEGEWTLDLPGRASEALSGGPALWTELGDARGYSGVARYRTRFALEHTAQRDRVSIELGEVRDIAQVTVNGVDCGVAWTAPFRVDVTQAARPGINQLEVHVANPWRNRLIAEAGSPTGAIFAPMTEVFDASADPLPAGLSGPVTIVTEKAV